MLSITTSVIVKEPYLVAPMLVDMSVGIVTLPAIIFIAYLLGGFNFFLPWVIASVPILFGAGFLRGASLGNLWVKAVMLNAVPLLLLSLNNIYWRLDGSADWIGGALGILPIAAVAVPPTAAGLFLRRRRIDRKRAVQEIHT